MKVKISALSYHLPEKVEVGDDLKRDNPDWDIPRIEEKTGVQRRLISAPDETAVDLAQKAGEKLLAGLPSRDDIDLLILVTQSPDYVLPTSACILQNRLGLSTGCMAFDVNLGCSGFVYALSVAGSLISSGTVHRGLILCSDTYTKYIGKNDRTCRPIFSDGAAAALVEASESDSLGPFEWGTDGAFYDRLIVNNSGARNASSGSCRGMGTLEMRGSDIFLFTTRVVPLCVNQLLARAGHVLEDVDLFVFHQASKFVLDNLTSKLRLDSAKVFTNIDSKGNTVSASIPIALKDAALAGRLKEGDLVMLIGFGVGLSWGATLIRWRGAV